MNKWVIRVFMILAWCLIIAAFLYSPYVTNWLVAGKSISVFSWEGMIDPDAIATFEKRTGIKVYVNYYESNEELLTKLELNKHQSYDIVMPSDYVVHRFINKQLLHKIDKSRITFLQALDQRLLNQWYDPNNHYSLPYFWYLYGIGSYGDRCETLRTNPSWAVLFDPVHAWNNIGLTDDPHEIVAVAARYLFGPVKQLSAEQVEQLIATLKKLKPKIALFSEVLTPDLLVHNVCSAMLIPSFIIGMAMVEDKKLCFAAPEEGSFMLIDNIVIPASCKKLDYVYQFINFIYQYDVMKMTVDERYYFATRADLLKEQDLSVVGGYEQLGKIMERTSYMSDIMTKHELNNLWITLKA